MLTRVVAAVLLVGSFGPTGAQEFQIQKVASVTAAGTDIRPRTILFNDHRLDDSTDRGAFIRFADWEKQRPLEKQFLALYPGLTEGTVQRIVDGTKKETFDELQMYVTEARFRVNRAAAAIDLKRYATLAFIESIDPAVKHQALRPSDISLLKDERSVTNRNPNRAWCDGPGVTACIRSTYKLEGRLPMGVALANKLREGERKLSDTIEFESEMRLLDPGQIDAADLQRLTGITTPIAGVLEQNMFHINQVLRFGKLVAVFQPNPSDAQSTIATVMIALAVSSHTLNAQKKYQEVPVLRNLVPSQVLLGNSSFNTGQSISSGLPNYVRNRIKAIASVLDRA